jgi:hypothetical protein
VKLTTDLHLVPRSKNAWSYTATPQVHLHGVVLSLKKQRNNFTFTLPLPLPFTFTCTEMFQVVLCIENWIRSQHLALFFSSSIDGFTTVIIVM